MRDIDIRRELRRKVSRQYGADPDTLVIEELGLCQGVVRVDLAVINGSIHGYEIKSELDTLDRLPGQSQIYNRVLDYVTIVASPTHAEKAAELVPEWWGVCIALPVKGGVILRSRRLPRRNALRDPFAFAQLLWRNEALEMLTVLGLADGMRSKPRDVLWRRLADHVGPGLLGKMVRQRLKDRATYWRAPLQQL
jgi:hypothetical protein